MFRLVWLVYVVCSQNNRSAQRFSDGDRTAQPVIQTERDDGTPVVRRMGTGGTGRCQQCKISELLQLTHVTKRERIERCDVKERQERQAWKEWITQVSTRGSTSRLGILDGGQSTWFQARGNKVS